MKKARVIFLSGIFLLCAAVLLAARSYAAGSQAQVLYEQNKQAVYQIRVINAATGKKVSIGSGFQISAQGHIATNYHVVEQVINKPALYKVEFLRNDQLLGPAAVVDADVIHDLAILQAAALPKKDTFYLPLEHSDLQKGARIFSMGNPYDLGMSIVEGTYNGLMERSLYKKILFSGSLNPGMSGGPVLSSSGGVMGINVSTQGNEISFIVPVEHLKELYARLLKRQSMPVRDWFPYIQEQLVSNQARYMGEILAQEWPKVGVGEFLVPEEISKACKCWSSPDREQEKDWFKETYVRCSSEDAIYVSPELRTGKINYQYLWLRSKDTNPFRFYNYYQRQFSYVSGFGNAQEEEAGNFECSSNFAHASGRDFKVTLCARNYKKYPQLYDIHLNAATIDRSDNGLIAELFALGLSKEVSLGLAEKFLKEIEWRK